MPGSQLAYPRELDACEAEDLVRTGEIQAGFDLLVMGPQGLVAGSDRCLGFDETTISAIVGGTPLAGFGPSHALIDAGRSGTWLRHTHNGFTLYEKPHIPLDSAAPMCRPWSDIVSASHASLWKLGFQVCDAVSEALNCSRAMIYRFHDDWSGEVIAETVNGDLEPFLGLHYPPTDIPKQARALFVETTTRHIFTTSRANTPVHLVGDAAAAVDLTHALSRSVSPYHIEYLNNMGTASTAACALMYKGALWGLLSLHFPEERLPSLAEFAFLQDFTSSFEGYLGAVLDKQSDDLTSRSDRMLDRFREILSESNDPFQTFVLSDSSLQRMLGAQGSCLIIGNAACNVGQVPALDISKALCKTLGKDLAPFEPVFLDRFPDDIPTDGRRQVAGCALARLSEKHDAYVLLFRTALNQSVSWGGDPRRVPQADDTNRYSPRKSFERWIENVEGMAAPWTDLPRQTFSRALSQTLTHFDTSPDELTVLLRNGLKQVSQNQDRLLANAVDAVDGIKTAIALAVVSTQSKCSKVVAMNSAASEALSIAPSEVMGLDLDEIEHALGAELENMSGESVVAKVVTANNGIRDCEVSIGLLFEYVNGSATDAMFKVQVFELRDVTEARRIEQALQSARDRAVRDMGLRAEFFAKLNHELRTPLNAVIGFSELLMISSAKLPDEKARKHLQMISQASQHLKEIVDSTLGNSHSIQRVRSSGLIATPVRQVVRESVAILAAAATSADIAISVDIPAGATVKVEPRALRQVLINIIGNAIKYNVPGGRVEIGLKSGESDLHILSVSDTGIGISDSDLTHCMLPYRRFAPGEGAGLGLSVANHMVAIMGGKLSMQSRLGKGTTVSIALPRDTDATPATAIRGAGGATGTAGLPR